MRVANIFNAAALILWSASLAYAQATLHRQQKSVEDFCAQDLDSAGNVNTPMANSDIYSCALDNYDRSLSDNPLAALKWWLIGAHRGDYSAAEQVSMMYAGQLEGVAKDLVQAYAWADIAASMHGTCIDRLPPSSGDKQEANEREIRLRDDIAREMTAEQIEEAQQVSNSFKITDYRWKWDAQDTPSRYVRMPTISPDCGQD